MKLDELGMKATIRKRNIYITLRHKDKIMTRLAQIKTISLFGWRKWHSTFLLIWFYSNKIKTNEACKH